METPKLLGLSHITNNSCHLLFSPKKVVPPKNIAQRTMFNYQNILGIMSVHEKEKKRETGGSNQAYSSSNS